MALDLDCHTKEYYTGNGTQIEFLIPFDLIEPTDVKVAWYSPTTGVYEDEIDGVIIEPNHPQYGYTIDITPQRSLIRFTVAPENNQRFLVYRLTPVDPLKANFESGYPVKAGDLNDNFEQLAHAIEDTRCIVEGILSQDLDESDLYWKKYGETIYSENTWVDSDCYIATSKAVELRLRDLVSMGINPPDAPNWDGQLWYDTDDGNLYVYYEDLDSNQWVNVSPGIGDAPSDGNIYARLDNQWSAITSTGGSGIVDINASPISTSYARSSDSNGSISWSALSTVASTGSYSDLTNAPIIPTQYWNQYTSTTDGITYLQPNTGGITFKLNSPFCLDDKIFLNQDGSASFDGVIESTTGGFKFPDGTTQLSTASAPDLSAYAQTSVVAITSDGSTPSLNSGITDVEVRNLIGAGTSNFSGSYADLSGKPTLGTAAATASTDYATAAQGTTADSAVQPGDLATVATSGSYTDLSNKPTIPTNNNQLVNGQNFITDYTVTSADVTAHEGDINITESQISDLKTYVESSSLNINNSNSSVVQRNANGDISTRLYRSEYANQTIVPPDDAAIAFRYEDGVSTNNYIRFIDNKSHIRSFLGVLASDVTSALNATLTGSGNISLGSSGGTQSIEVGAGQGGIAMITNDGYGNAQVTFNHKQGIPDQNGSSYRIKAAVDSSTPKMEFWISDGAVTSGVLASTTTAGENFLEARPADVRINKPLFVDVANTGASSSNNLTGFMSVTDSTDGSITTFYGDNTQLNPVIRIYDGNSSSVKIDLSADGSGTFTSTVSAQGSVLTSDQRFKTNITNASSQLADVTALGSQLRNWNWTDDAPIADKNVRFLGLVAQDVEAICPGLVTTVHRTKQGEQLTPDVLDEEGTVIKSATFEKLDDSYKGIKNDVLIMKLLGAVSELKAANDNLQSRIDSLELNTNNN